MTKLQVSTLVVLAATTSAQALTTSYQWIDRGVPTNGTTVATGYHAYTLEISADSVISGVDINTWGIGGPLVQRWVDTDDDGVLESTPGYYTTQNITPSVSSFDSHFLAPASSANTLSERLSEDATFGPVDTQFGTFPTNTASAAYGLGTTMKAAYGIVAAGQQKTIDVAYIVVPEGGTVSFNLELAVGSGTAILSNWPTWTGRQSNIWSDQSGDLNWDQNGQEAAYVQSAGQLFTQQALAHGPQVQIDPSGITTSNIDIEHSLGTLTFGGGPLHVTGHVLAVNGAAKVFNSPLTVDGQLAASNVLFNSTVSAGTAGLSNVGGNGTILSDVTLASTTVIPGGPNHVGVFTFAGKTVMKSTTLDVDVSGEGTDRIDAPQLDVANSYGDILIFDDGAVPGQTPILTAAGTINPAKWHIRGASQFAPFALDGLNSSLVSDPLTGALDLKLAWASTPAEWSGGGSGVWTAANWGGSVPVDLSIARLAPTATARTVEVDDNATCNMLRMEGAADSIVGSGTLNMYYTIDHLPTIFAANGTHVIGTTIAASSGINVMVAHGASLNISGSTPAQFSVEKYGSGTLELSGPLNKPGIIAQDGVVRVDGTVSGVGQYFVVSGATLMGTALGGSLTLNGGALSPAGDGIIGTAAVASLSLGNAILNIDIGSGSADRIETTSLFSGANAALFNINSIGEIQPGIYTLLDYSGAAITTTSGFTLSAPNLDGYAASLIFDSANTAIELQVTQAISAVPEPATAFYALGAALILHRRRRYEVLNGS